MATSPCILQGPVTNVFSHDSLAGRWKGRHNRVERNYSTVCPKLRRRARDDYAPQRVKFHCQAAAESST